VAAGRRVSGPDAAPPVADCIRDTSVAGGGIADDCDPLKASGHWITVSWLVEGLALLWVAARLEPRGGQADADESYATKHAALAGPRFAPPGILRNLRPHRKLGGCDRVATAELGDGNRAHRHRSLRGGSGGWRSVLADTARDGLVQRHTLDWGSIAIVGFILIDLTAALLTLRELVLSWDWGDLHPPFQTADFATALIGLAVFAGVVGVSIRIARGQRRRLSGRVAALSTDLRST